jgi:hypothetical protein
MNQLAIDWLNRFDHNRDWNCCAKLKDQPPCIGREISGARWLELAGAVHLVKNQLVSEIHNPAMRTTMVYI